MRTILSFAGKEGQTVRIIQRRPATVRWICFICIFLLLFSFVLVFIEAGHVCSGDDCPVCMLLRKVLPRGIPDLFTAGSVFSVALAALYTAFLFLKLCLCKKRPVLEKIRMND